MVYTVTLNPALDRTLFVDTLALGESSRIRREARYAGGKGVDVSRALVEMDVPTVALGLVGGFDGKEFEGRLLNEGVACDFTRISGEIRTNIVIHGDEGLETALLARGPEVQPVELMNFMDHLEGVNGSGFLVVSGSLPPGLTPAVYGRILSIGRDKGLTTVLDASGEALRTGIRARPDVIKPNRSELAELAGTEPAGPPGILRFCRTIQEEVATILVSLGADGILLVQSGRGLLARPPQVEVKSTVGAGDCAVAGFIAGLARDESPADCLRRAVAAGTAATLTPGTGICCREDIARLLPDITLEEVTA
ncbi:MAG TPA: 1-phosphofructokinase [candidate division WOR-3 bacterium]|uniref:1-phosphofructokinase n=1 Tax=candidate division WOR-3 bacterium TaxID=2052148 RepID=A0A7V0T500_UNCW3|nr:1-phosphofructokinase [candidate division WOR-3 bacterium]